MEHIFNVKWTFRIAIWLIITFFAATSTVFLLQKRPFQSVFQVPALQEVPTEEAEKIDISYRITNEMIDSLQAPVPKFIQSLDNPCWEEALPSPTYKMYDNNSYRLSRPHELPYFFDKLRHLYKPWHNKRRRCLPNFYILGFSKCGTTDLYKTLKKHPNVSKDIPVKEPGFWNRHNFAREPITRRILKDQKKSFSSYVDLYDLAAFKIIHNREKLIVDASASYIWDYGDWPNLPQNKGLKEPSIITAHFIRHFTPRAKFIILVREPSDRLYSQYLYSNKEGESKFSFHAAVVESIDLMQRCMKERSQRDCLYDPTFNRTMNVWLRINHYVTFIQDWLSVFPREQFYFLRLEDYMANKTKAIIEISRFLGTGELSKSYMKYLISADQYVANARSPEDMEIGDMLPETKLILQKYFDPWNKRLAALLNDSSFIYPNKS